SPLGTTWPPQADQTPAVQLCVPRRQVPWVDAPAGQGRETTLLSTDGSVSSQSGPAQPVPTPYPSPSRSVQLGQLRTQVPAGHVQLPQGAAPKWDVHWPALEQTKPASPPASPCTSGLLVSVFAVSPAPVSGPRSVPRSTPVSAVGVSAPVSAGASLPRLSLAPLCGPSGK